MDQDRTSELDELSTLAPLFELMSELVRQFGGPVPVARLSVLLNIAQLGSGTIREVAEAGGVDRRGKGTPVAG